MAKPPPTVAATSTLAMVRAATARGVRTHDVLTAAGLAPGFLEDPDARIPGPIVLAIWNELRRRTADPALQLFAPTSLPFGAYRVIDYLVASSPTVGEGIDRFARFFGLIADGVQLRIHCDGREHCLELTMADGGPVPPVYVDYVFAALVSRIRMKIRTRLRVHGVEFRQPEPTNAEPYARVFRAPVRFGASADRLCFDDAEWNSATESGDVALAGLVEDHARILAERIPQAPPGFTIDVQKAIASAPPGAGSAEAVARALHVSVRTLQRRLVAAGTTFREVADSVRHQIAVEYLADPGVSIAEIAFLLGFSDQTSFNRAFRRWTGVSPGRWRRQRVVGGARAGAATNPAPAAGEIA